MAVARQEWLDWEFDPPGFSKYGCDDIGDLLSSGQMSVEFLDDDDREFTEEEVAENRQCHRDFREIIRELRESVSYSEGETEKEYEERILWDATKQAGLKKDQREKERMEKLMAEPFVVPDAM
jgi:hypothetical protein